MKTFRIILFACIVLLAGDQAIAQIQHFSAQSLGMGGGGTAYQDGYHANFINPANLMLKRHRRPNTSVGLANVAVNAGGTLVNIPVYNSYLTDGLTIEGQTRVNFLTDLFGSSNPNDMNDISVSADIIPLAFSNRGNVSSFSFAVRSRVLAKYDVSRGFAELGFYGLDAQQFADPRNVDIRGEAVAFGEVSIGYARKVLELPNLLFAKNIKIYAGVAPKFIITGGYNAFDLQSTMQINPLPGGSASRITHDFDLRIDTYGDLGREFEEYRVAKLSNEDASVDDFIGDGAYEDLGFSGMAFDLGGTAEMDISGIPFLDMPIFGKKTLTLGFSLTDLGAVKFDDAPVTVRNARTFVFEGAVDTDIDNFYDGLADSLESDVYLNIQSVDEADEIRFALPSTMNFGAHLQMGKLGTSIDYSVGFNGNGTNSQFSTLILGAEYRFFNFLPLRVGMRNGGFTSRVYTAGLGLDFRFLELTFAAALPSKRDVSGSGVATAFSGLNFRF